MKQFFLLLFILPAFVFGHSDHVHLEGKVGKYPVEVFVTSADWLTGEFSGKYRYMSKEKFLEIKGVTLNDVISFSEYYKGESTGDWFLEFEGSKLTGKWIGGGKSYPVELDVVHGNSKLLSRKTLQEFSEETNTDVNGVYAVETYWLNDMWFREDNPQMEVGYNGGFMVLEQIHKDSLKFTVEAICGPTYHFAYASGVAHRTDSTWVYIIENEEEDGAKEEGNLTDDCVIQLTLSERGVAAKANFSYICGFGARAYLDHEFDKVLNEVHWPEDGQLNLQELLGRQRSAND